MGKPLDDLAEAMKRHHATVGSYMDRPNDEAERVRRANGRLDALLASLPASDRAAAAKLRASLIADTNRRNPR